jgi:hypothetical protein
MFKQVSGIDDMILPSQNAQFPNIRYLLNSGDKDEPL